MELRHLRYFVLAAELANISRAAERLNVSQPAVSRQIMDLEEEFGLKLFLREPTGLRLTEAGSSALLLAREVLRQSELMQETMQLLAQQASGVVVKVGFLPTAMPKFFTSALRRFHEAHPTYQIQILEMDPGEQEEALREGRIDLGLIGNPRSSVKKSFRVAPIVKVPLVMIVPDNHRFVGRKSVSLSEFEGDAFVAFHEENFAEQHRFMVELLKEASIQPKSILRARGISELLGLVGGGAGVAIAPADLEDMPHGGAVFIPLRNPKRTLTFSAAWPKGKTSTELTALLDVIRMKS